MENSDVSIHKAILKTVLYADIFDYPLTFDELHRYLVDINLSREQLAEQLRQDQFLTQSGGYFTLPRREELIQKRAAREGQAVLLWREANRFGLILSKMPFVRMVAVTGSLAMNNVERSADIDYLVVTTPGRLWLCRLGILVLVRLAALRGVSLCPNYMLSEHALEIPAHSLYSAHEFTQMVPLSGLEIYQRMRQLNPWVMDYLPNAHGLPSLASKITASTTRPVIRRLLELILRTAAFDWMEGWEMKRKISKLSAQNKDNPESQFTAELCKGHSSRHGQRTTVSLNERLAFLEQELIP
jgi:hypothetical protein